MFGGKKKGKIFLIDYWIYNLANYTFKKKLKYSIFNILLDKKCFTRL